MEQEINIYQYRELSDEEFVEEGDVCQHVCRNMSAYISVIHEGESIRLMKNNYSAYKFYRKSIFAQIFSEKLLKDL